MAVAYGTGNHENDKDPQKHLVRVWDTDTGKEVTVLAGHEGGVLGVTFSRDGARLATAGGDGTARLWQATFGDELARQRGRWDQTVDAVVSPDGRFLLTSNTGIQFNDPADRFSASVWDIATGREVARLRDHENIVQRLAFSPDGTKVLTTVGFGSVVRVWEAATGKLLHKLDGPTGQIIAARFTDDSQRVAVTAGNMRAWLWT